MFKVFNWLNKSSVVNFVNLIKTFKFLSLFYNETFKGKQTPLFGRFAIERKLSFRCEPTDNQRSMLEAEVEFRFEVENS
jgi:hypothetical protein